MSLIQQMIKCGICPSVNNVQITLYVNVTDECVSNQGELIQMW